MGLGRVGPANLPQTPSPSREEMFVFVPAFPTCVPPPMARFLHGTVVLWLCTLTEATTSPRVLHFTDLHVHTTMAAEEQVAINDLHHQDAHATTTNALWRSALSAAAQANASFVIWGGDTGPQRCETCFPYEQRHATEAIGVASTALRELLPGVRIFPVIGNTDFAEGAAHVNYADAWAHEASQSALQAWLSNGSRRNLLSRGYYSEKVDDVWRVVVLNTRACHIRNFADFKPAPNAAEQPGLPFFEDQLAWFRQQLADARLHGSRVIVTGHVPPGIWGGCWGEFSDEYEDIVASFADVVALQIFGHQHSGSSRLLRAFADGADRSEQDATASSVAFITPSIAPQGGQMPSFRVYTVDPGRAQPVVGFEQYRLDLERPTNADGNVLWQLSYQAPVHLGLASLSPEEWRRVVQHAATNATYRSLLMKLESNGKDWHAGTKSAKDYACGIKHVGEPAYLRCAGKNQEGAVRDYIMKDHTYVLSAIFPFDVIMSSFGHSLPGILEEDLLPPE